jgi:hypothetical protein
VLDDLGGGDDRLRLGGRVGVGRVIRILIRHGVPLFRVLRGLMHGKLRAAMVRGNMYRVPLISLAIECVLRGYASIRADNI